MNKHTWANVYTEKLCFTHSVLIHLTFYSKILAAEALSFCLALLFLCMVGDGCGVMGAVHQKAFLSLFKFTGDLSLSILVPLVWSFFVLFYSSPSLFFWAAHSCSQDGGEFEIILFYIWLQMWGCSLQTSSL